MSRMPTSLSSSGLVQLVIRRPLAGQCSDSHFFTTWDTLELSQWRSDKVSQLLQIAASKHFGCRPFAQEFDITKEVNIAQSIAQANPQHGPGGGMKLFIPPNEQISAVVPVGDLIPLYEPSTLPIHATGFIKSIIEIEISLGNTFVGSDRDARSGARNRFWLQNPLHLADITRLKIPTSVRAFEEPDMHGNVMGFITTNESQVVLAPMQ
ncbi:MAG: hypothetical protein AAB263_07165 [Planctomycetota bacterium]